MELAAVGEVVQHLPKIRAGLSNLKSRFKTLSHTLSGEHVDNLQSEVATIAVEIENLIERIEELEAQIEQDRLDAEHNQAVFEAVWTWSQQGWWKRAFSRPQLPSKRLWRGNP